MRSLILFMIWVLFLGFGCDTAEPEKKQVVIQSPQPITAATQFENKVDGFTRKPGLVGIANVPEMLCLSIIDSASSKALGATISQTYDSLQSEVSESGATVNGPPGYLAYTNNPKNIRFECVLLISTFPKQQPKKAKVVVLEADNMILYNYYGRYENLFSAYGNLKSYCEKMNLEQSGPMREFYITDPATEPDPRKWLTRIFLPVNKKEKEEVHELYGR
jgi:effector-binding domain-containing protein